MAISPGNGLIKWRKTSLVIQKRLYVQGLADGHVYHLRQRILTQIYLAIESLTEWSLLGVSY